MKQRIKKLTVNASEDVMCRLDELVARNRPFATRHAIHELALRLGLEELLTHPWPQASTPEKT